MPILNCMKKLGRSLLGALVVTLTLTACATAQTPNDPPRYARAEKPTPVLNTPDFRSAFGGADGKTLARDSQGLIRAVEFIALPGTVFYIENAFNVNGALMYQINTADYPPQKTGLFIDSRFVSLSKEPLQPRSKKMPPEKTILERMASKQGLRYVWGGNTSQGIPEMFQFYPPSQKLSRPEEDMWALYGLDCSGLLYEAADGATPRNTSDLIAFGKPVLIEGLSPTQIAAKLQPLDLIVWKGHVIIVLDQHNTIESCIGCSANGGVTVRDLHAVIKQVMSQRRAVNNYPTQTAPNDKPFVVRRFI